MPLLAPLQRSRLDLFDGHSGKRDAFPEERDIRGQSDPRDKNDVLSRIVVVASLDRGRL